MNNWHCFYPQFEEFSPSKWTIDDAKQFVANSRITFSACLVFCKDQNLFAGKNHAACLESNMDNLNFKDFVIQTISEMNFSAKPDFRINIEAFLKKFLYSLAIFQPVILPDRCIGRLGLKWLYMNKHNTDTCPTQALELISFLRNKTLNAEENAILYQFVYSLQNVSSSVFPKFEEVEAINDKSVISGFQISILETSIKTYLYSLLTNSFFNSRHELIAILQPDNCRRIATQCSLNKNYHNVSLTDKKLLYIRIFDFCNIILLIHNIHSVGSHKVWNRKATIE
jgi:hypothetical protein